MSIATPDWNSSHQVGDRCDQQQADHPHPAVALAAHHPDETLQHADEVAGVPDHDREKGAQQGCQRGDRRLRPPAIKLRHQKQVPAGSDWEEFGRALEDCQDQDVNIRHADDPRISRRL
jgi:hypothetical protein